MKEFLCLDVTLAPGIDTITVRSREHIYTDHSKYINLHPNYSKYILIARRNPSFNSTLLLFSVYPDFFPFIRQSG